MIDQKAIEHEEFMKKAERLIEDIGIIGDELLELRKENKKLKEQLRNNENRE